MHGSPGLNKDNMLLVTLWFCLEMYSISQKSHVFWGGAFGRWLEYEGANLTDGLIHWWLQSWKDYYGVEPIWRSRSLGVSLRTVSCPLPLPLFMALVNLLCFLADVKQAAFHHYALPPGYSCFGVSQTWTEIMSQNESWFFSPLSCICQVFCSSDRKVPNTHRLIM